MIDRNWNSYSNEVIQGECSPNSFTIINRLNFKGKGDKWRKNLIDRLRKGGDRKNNKKWNSKGELKRKRNKSKIIIKKWKVEKVKLLTQMLAWSRLINLIKLIPIKVIKIAELKDLIMYKEIEETQSQVLSLKVIFLCFLLCLRIILLHLLFMEIKEFFLIVKVRLMWLALELFLFLIFQKNSMDFKQQRQKRVKKAKDKKL